MSCTELMDEMKDCQRVSGFAWHAHSRKLIVFFFQNPNISIVLSNIEKLNTSLFGNLEISLGKICRNRRL